LVNYSKKITPMRRYFILMLIVVAGFLFVNFNIADSNIPQEEVKSEKPQYHVPDDVQQIIDNSCYGCHNSESKNEKGKKKLQFDKMSDLKTYKQVGSLADIADVVTEGDMPPEKFLKKYPERQPSKEEQERLVSWANNLAKQLTPED